MRSCYWGITIVYIDDIYTIPISVIVRHSLASADILGALTNKPLPDNDAGTAEHCNPSRRRITGQVTLETLQENDRGPVQILLRVV